MIAMAVYDGGNDFDGGSDAVGCDDGGVGDDEDNYEVW